MLSLTSGAIGAVGRKLVAGWANRLGLRTDQETVDHKTFVVVNGARVQVKTSTLWANNTYKFQQIRDDPYDRLLCLGVSPDDFHAWLIPKTEALTHASGQHTGAAARETRWITAIPNARNGWLDEYGGQLADVARLLTRL
ncbi:hypothetical protein [Schumannella luteola]